MIPLKNDTVYAALSDRGFAEADNQGVFRFDTRVMGRYAWALGDFRLLSQKSTSATLDQVWSLLQGRDQRIGLRRRLRLLTDGFEDALEFANTSLEPQTLALALQASAHFADIYTLSPIWGRTRPAEVELKAASDGSLHADDLAGDGVRTGLHLTVTPSINEGWTRTLDIGETFVVSVRATLTSDLGAPSPAPRPTPAAWRSSFEQVVGGQPRSTTAQALDDIYALLTSWNGRTVVAAGIPWFVCLFGRDSLITARFCLAFAPWLARDILVALASAQGSRDDPFREEQPGKIAHVQRRGPLARAGEVPFGRYYGTADATPLWVWLLADYVEATGDEALLDELSPALEAAVGWIRRSLEETGFITFAPHGGGLKVQSWKDSSDSMSHADGRLAEPPIAPVEVQAYAWAALQGAARLASRRGDKDAAATLGRDADSLRARFEAAFWLEELGTYALALDGSGSPLAVMASNAGHVLWTGIALPDRAASVARVMLSEALWSGWGVRTLGTGERRYNPISYHNGGVWPHDTAIFAGGLHRYGLLSEFEKVRTALHDLAAAAPDGRLPELVAGMPREEALPPVPDPFSCRPQAWSAASLPYLDALASDPR